MIVMRFEYVIFSVLYPSFRVNTVQPTVLKHNQKSNENDISLQFEQIGASKQTFLFHNLREQTKKKIMHSDA